MAIAKFVLPLVEETQLFARGVGEATDIVEKMFGVVHGGNKGDEGSSFTLRPEGTAGCVRAIVEHSNSWRYTKIMVLRPDVSL